MKFMRVIFVSGLAALLFAGALTVSGCATAPGSSNSADTDVLRTKTFGQ